jgi:iron complex transport system permease protein
MVTRVILPGIALFLLAALLLPLIGPSQISLARAWQGISPDAQILFEIRLPRVWLALLAGGALAVAGVVCQALLRDALATPYTLGVSSGASLGAVLAIVLNWINVWIPASIGAACTVLLVVALASEGRRLSSFTLLLAGVTLNSMSLALILVIQNLANLGKSIVIMRWLMGGIDTLNAPQLLLIACITLAVCGMLFTQARLWNLMAVGEEWAAARGVATRHLAFTGYAAISLLTGVITAFTGPIGFVGLIVPHALRLRYGADHRLLIPASFFGGAVFLAICDTAARLVLAPAELPVGVITALLGGPFFVWLLRSRRRSLWL